MKKITIRLDAELADALADHAADAEVSQNSLIAELLAAALNGRGLTKRDAKRAARAAADAAYLGALRALTGEEA